jgi:hypothetical protein
MYEASKPVRAGISVEAGIISAKLRQERNHLPMPPPTGLKSILITIIYKDFAPDGA